MSSIKKAGAVGVHSELEQSFAGRILVLSLEQAEVARVALPPQFRLGSADPAAWRPDLFKEFLSEVTGATVEDIYYRVRERKHVAGKARVRMAQLGVDDDSSEWPFVPGMKVFIRTSEDVGKAPPTLSRGASAATLSNTSSSTSVSSCSLM